MDDDFETPEAMASLFELIKEVNVFAAENELNKGDQEVLLDYLKRIDEVFAFILPKKEEVSVDVEKLIEERNEARANKDFKRADEIRDILKEKGIVLEDLPEGTVWKKV